MLRLCGFIAIALVLGASLARAETPQEARNKAAAIAFYEALNNSKNWEQARQYVGDHWIEHSPKAHPQNQSVDIIENFAKVVRTLHPQSQSIILRAFAEGDLVALQVHNIEEPGALGVAMINFFRFENGKIVESWPVYQVVPGVLNYNGIF